MKHNVKMTILILSMFLVTQFIRLYVVDNYAKQRDVIGEINFVENPNILPYGMDVPEVESTSYQNNFVSIMISFVIAILILFLLTHVKAKLVLKTWFFLVTMIALGISFNSFLPHWTFAPWIALGIALPLAIFKVYKRGFLSHNFSELLIYPGIAAVFVPLLNLKTAIILLVVISIYDMWAVWKSKIMQKMAKFQMNELNIFSGFFIPYASKKQREKIKHMKETDKKGKGMKVNVAILGGGDVIFPIITSGVVLKTWGIWPAVAVILGALLGLGSLLFFSEKKKFYPAMPFISAGIFLALLISWIII